MLTDDNSYGSDPRQRSHLPGWLLTFTSRSLCCLPVAAAATPSSSAFCATQQVREESGTDSLLTLRLRPPSRTTTTGPAAAKDVQVPRRSPTHHIFDRALVISEVILGQQGEHEPLDAVDVQAHLNRSAVPAGLRTTLGSPSAHPRPAALPRPGTGCAPRWGTARAPLHACSWQLTPASEL